MFRAASAAGAAVKKHRRLAVRIAAQLPIHLMTVTGIEKAVLVGFD
jgi:hypothetical protein